MKTKRLNRHDETDDRWRIVQRAVWLANAKPTDWRAVYRKLKVLPPGARFAIDRTGRVRLKVAPPLRPRVAERLRRQLVVALDSATRPKARPGVLDRRDSMLLAGAWGRPYVEAGQVRLSPGSVITPTFDAFIGYACAVLRDPTLPLLVRRCAYAGCKRFFVVERRRAQPPKTCSPTCQKHREKLLRR